LKGEDEYYLTSFDSAINFIKDLKKTDLKLNMNEQLKFDNLEGANEILQFSDFVAQE
jgi:hypothetical protein